ncbi:hypothetical protein DTO282E5_5985 [Paecilomyces variotii]|nr:hypothetical protein DTO282E5_5985 [Paecilomyces variotii]
MREGNRYIKSGTTLFPCPSSTDISNLRPDQEVITVLSKQTGGIVVEHDSTYVTKSGERVRPAEAEAMRLVSKHTSVPVPEVFFATFDPDWGRIVMSLIPGSSLEKIWDTLDGKTKEYICLQVWDMISKIRAIPRPPELNGLFQCAADGSLTRDPLLEDLKDPARPLTNDSDLRARIFERYYHFAGRRYEHELPNMLPRSSCSVFTHADIAPRNIMVDEQNRVTGILDWEHAGWYPDYWEYAQILRPAFRAITSSTKRRKVAEPRRPGAHPAASFASRARHADSAGRRHGHHPHSPSADSSSLPLPPPLSSTSESNLSANSSASPSPRYIPAHLQDEVLGTRTKAGPRSPTPEPYNADSPSAACAGLSLNSDPVTEMSGSEASQGEGSQQGGREMRSSSPAVKRPASQIGDEERRSQDVEMDVDPSESQSNERPGHRRATSVDMIDQETTEGSGNDGRKDNLYPTPSSMSTYTASATSKESSAKSQEAAEVPSIDEQVAEVTRLVAAPLKEKQKGYVISAKWLNKVMSRASSNEQIGDKAATEGEIGPVDNSDLVLITDPAATFKDEAGEPFVPLRPGLQLGEDYEIVPQEAWDRIMKWYGLSERSPAIVRYAHNTNSAGGEENIQYEINPPIFTILKLANPASGITPQTLKEKNMAPIKTLASRHTNFQKWLKQVKGLANIDITTKVRVWRILGGLGGSNTSGMVTPAASRSASPAPGAVLAASAGNNFSLDVNTFVSLTEGSQRELLEDARDQTANEKYNGKMTIELAGLAGNEVVVLEEQIGGPAGGEWVSDVSKQTLNRLGLTADNNKNANQKVKAKSTPTSGRSSPAPEPTRGRRKDGKPRGATGLSNLGNTCYMNSALQCVRSVEELTYYFLNDFYKRDLNPSNPLAHNGDIAKAYAHLLHMIYDEAGPSSFAPRQLKHTVGRYGPAFSGYGQQDSQEFLLFLLDGLQEDLNRIQKKPYIEKPDSTDEMVHDFSALKGFANKCWDIYKARNDSVITDLFAGMYKSTLHCPECDKVSIIFDPFNNLTLQLPIENLWSKEIFYFPLHKRPVLVDVEIDKNSSIKALKEMVAKKMGSDPQKLIMAEVYKSKFYKMFDNNSSIADYQIGAGDDIGIFEVEAVPTNYNPDKPKKAFSSMSFHMDHEQVPSFDSPKADRMLVPIFNRVVRPNTRSNSRQLFGAPSYTIITREEAYDYDAIFRKVLAEVDTLTTRDLLNEDLGGELDGTQEDSDTVVMNDDDAQSADSKIKTASVEGEDGLVDVSMRDADRAPEASSNSSPVPYLLRPGTAIPAGHRNLFQMKIVRSNEVVPLGFSSVDENKDFPLMSSRIKKVNEKRTEGKGQAKHFPDGTNSPVSSDDELADASEGVPVDASSQKAAEESDDSDSRETRSNNDSESGSDDYTRVPSRKGRPNIMESKKGKSLPLIRPGEGIVLDWNEQAHDALFGASAKDRDPLRGAPTWTNVEHVPDPELYKKRQLRQSRKKKGITLNECLDEFGKEEILSENDAWYCPRCKEHRRASKKFELWKTPDILVMHLKRFSANRGFRDKIDVVVDFPIEGLDLTGRVAAPEEGKSMIYDLFAVDNHYGGLGGGHYTAFAKNFMTNEWNEYNDSHVSKPIDPQKVITSAAYLLFYRRRSDRPLGGKVLEEIVESATRGGATDSDSQTDSRAPSPSGEDRRLGGSSRNGSSSALAGVGAAHQAGDGGSQAVTQVRSVEADDDDDMPPGYFNGLPSGEQGLEHADRLEGMDLEDEYFGGEMRPNPLNFPTEPLWSFDRASDAHGPSQMTAAPPGSYFDGEDEDLFDDDASNKAVGGGDLSDSDIRLAALGDSSEGPGASYTDTTFEDSSIQNIPPPLDADDDDDLPVIELRVDEEDKIVPDKE